MSSPFRLSLERKPGSHVGCSLRPRLISPAGLCLFVLPEHSSRKSQLRASFQGKKSPLPAWCGGPGL